MNRLRVTRSLAGILIVLAILVAGASYAAAACAGSDCVTSGMKEYLGTVGKGSAAKLTAAASKQPGGAPATAFGFTGQTSKEKLSFEFGILMSDMRIIALTDDQNNMRAYMTAFVKALAELGAPPAVLAASASLRDRMNKSADPIAEYTKGFPSVSNGVTEFILNKMDASYAVLGLWAETARVLLAVDELAESFIRENDAADLLNDLKGADLPPGVVSALKALDSLKARKQISGKDIAAAQKAIEGIFDLMA